MLRRATPLKLGILTLAVVALLLCITPTSRSAVEALPQRLLYCFEFRGGGDPDGRITRSLEYLRGREWER